MISSLNDPHSRVHKKSRALGESGPSNLSGGRSPGQCGPRGLAPFPAQRTIFRRANKRTGKSPQLLRFSIHSGWTWIVLLGARWTVSGETISKFGFHCEWGTGAVKCLCTVRADYEQKYRWTEEGGGGWNAGLIRKHSHDSSFFCFQLYWKVTRLKILLLCKLDTLTEHWSTRSVRWPRELNVMSRQICFLFSISFQFIYLFLPPSPIF